MSTRKNWACLKTMATLLFYRVTLELFVEVLNVEEFSLKPWVRWDFNIGIKLWKFLGVVRVSRDVKMTIIKSN